MPASELASIPYRFADGVRHYRTDFSLHLAGQPNPNRDALGLFFLPGYSDHLGRYGEWFQHFSALGYSVWGMDPVGHGLSAGPRGYVRRFADYTDDLLHGLATAQQLDPRKHWLLVGHSTGGLMCLSALLRRESAFKAAGVMGTMVTSPLLKIRLPVPPFKRFLGELASRCWPRLCLTGGGEPYANSHDPQQEQRRFSDPLVFWKVNVRWYTEVCREMAYVLGQAPQLNFPLLGLQAGDDRVVDPKAAQAFFTDCPDATYREFPHMYHEILLESDCESVYAAMAAWAASLHSELITNTATPHIQ